MKKYQTLLLAALVALGGVNAGAQTNNISSLAITTGVVAVTQRIGPNTTPLNNQPVGNNLAGMAYAAGNIPGAADTSVSLFTLTAAAIPGGIGNPADAFTSYGTLIGPPTVYGSYADVSAKLLSNNYAGLTFAAPNLYSGGPAPLTSNGFYMIHRATNGTDYLSAIVPLTGGNSDVVNLKPMSWAGGSAATGANTGLNGFFALAFAGPQPTGLYNANDFYYFRTDGATTRFGYVIPALTSGYLDTINLNTAVGGFGVGGYTTLAFSDTAIGGYAVNQFYYLRTDSGTGGTGHTILGRLDTNPAARTISDIANLGGTYQSLVFAADATGAAGAWGTNQFYVTGTRALTAQSVSFAAIADQATGVSFTVSPSASSGLAMTLAVVAGSTGAASISAPVAGVFTVTPTAPGVITLRATQAGQAAPASPVYLTNMLRQSFNATGTTLLAITTQPTAQSAVTGTTANFSVVASGTTALSYQWRKAGVNISGMLNASAATANLALTNVQSADQASYDVAVTNASGTIYSNSVALTVTVPAGVAPVITNSPLTAGGTVGSAFSFTITASNSPTSYSASGLPAGLAINTSTGAITGTPTTAATTSVTLGATNATGTGNATLTITVAALPAAPTFASSAFSAAGTVGVAFSYSIAATGSPTSYVASPLPAGLVRNATTGVISGTPTTPGTTSVQLGATNSLGTGNATLTITITAAAAPPTVITQPVNRTVTAGQSTTFTVAAGNDPSVTYQWQRLPFGSTTWENLREGGSYRGVTTATLVVSDPTRATSGDQFRAVITNSTHTTTSNPVALTVTGGETALFQYPGSIAMDSAGNLYVADSFNNTIRKITPAGSVSTLAGSAGMAGSQNGTGDAARFNQPGGVAVDAAGNVYVADTGNATIRKITSAGVVTTLAGTADVRGNSDGVGSAATFGSPGGIAIDSAGNLYVADAFNATIRKITSTGTVSTLAGSPTLRGTADGAGAAARFNYPNGVAVDAAGTIYVADTYNATIRKITSAGVVTTLAGLAGVSGADNGTGIMALFNQPNGLAVDTSGNVYVADTGNSTVRRITPAGVVTTLAGVPGIAGLENGPGGNALFNQPRGLVVSGSQIFVADTGNATIRVIAANNAVSTLTMAAASTGSPAPLPGSTPSPTPTPTPTPSGSGGGGAPSPLFLGLLALLAAVRKWFNSARKMKLANLVALPVVVVGLVLSSPVTGSAQSILLSAGNFTLLGGTAITSTGTAGTNIVNGNVGLSPGATTGITGFPPAVITGGGGIVATGAVTSQARLDLITASVGLAGMPSNVNMSNVNLGGTTLAPGVYTFNGAAALSGALVLDAQGQNNVAWVFQIGTSLTTAVNSSVTIINLGSNGGTDLGVFWVAGSAVTIGANNQIVGNYLSGTSITLGGVTTVGGRALALAGISLDSNVVNAAGGPGGGGLTGGLTYNAGGAVVPLTVGASTPGAVVVPGGVVTSTGTVISGGTVVPGSSAGSSGSVTLNSAGVYTAGASIVRLIPGTPNYTTLLTVDGNIANGASPARLTITGATVTLTGVNTHTGGTFVDAGALVASTANLPVNQNISLTNGSSLVLNQAAAGTFGGVVSGNGSLAKLGTGALTLTGSNTYTGGTSVNGGSLIASSTTLPAAQNVAVAASSTLVFNQTSDGTFSGNITGSGTVQKQGAAKLTLTNPTATAFNLQAGSLYFNGGIGTTTVGVGSLLGGNGTVTGNLTNHGTVSPGFSPGTINVTGNYVQSSTGTLVIQLASASSFDRLAVTGTATLAGTVQFDLLAGYRPTNQSFTFLTASSVSGTFGTITGNGIVTNSPTSAATVIYGSNNVTFSIAQLPFATFGLTPNQRAIGAAVQASPALSAVLNTLPLASQFPATFNALSPQGYEIWSDLAFGRATAISDRLLRDNGAVAGQDDYYFDASQRRGRVRRDADVGASTFTSTAGLVGMDRVMNSTLTVGGFFNYEESVAGLGSSGSRTTVKSKMPGVRVASTRGPWTANASLGYAFDDYKSSRPVVFPGTSAVAVSSTNGHQWFADLSLSRLFTFGDLNVSPFAGVLLSEWWTDRFTETGAGIYNVTVAGQSARSLRTQLGVEGQMIWKVGSLQLQPHVRAAWLSEFADDRRSLRAAFGSVNYTLASRKPERESALFSAGLNVMFDPRAMLYTAFTAQSGGNTKYLSDWRVGISVVF